MSEPYDLDEDRRGTVLVTENCERCNVEFRCEARPDTVASDGYQGPPTPLERYCRSCSELGFDPPESPCCAAKLEGLPDGELACVGCDTAFSPRDIRTYAFGMECARILREATARGPGAFFTAPLFKAARELGVIR